MAKPTRLKPIKTLSERMKTAQDNIIDVPVQEVGTNMPATQQSSNTPSKEMRKGPVSLDAFHNA